MTATSTSLPVHDILHELANELHDCGPSGAVTGETVVSCFKNIICVEHRARIAELPELLHAVFTEVDTHSRNIYDVAELTARLARIGKELV